MRVRYTLGAALAAVGLAGGGFHAPAHAAMQGQAGAPDLSWTRIPAGTFQMGCVPGDTRCDPDELPRHAVTFSRPFEMMTTEVTVSVFQAVTKDIDEQPPWSTSPDHPVVIVPWTEARAFCEAVGARLPTEAEWEYAARGGKNDAIYPWGHQEPDDRPGIANGAAFEGGGGRAVKTYLPNGFGLYDMAGNVWEWVADWAGRYGPDPVIDPKGPAAGAARSVRGGSYGDDSRNLRVSNRSANRASAVNFNIGFRCARDVS
jgi:formylglycine-generating enzyme required for sulfatase activity